MINIVNFHKPTKRQVDIKMRKFTMFITAACLLILGYFCLGVLVVRSSSSSFMTPLYCILNHEINITPL